MGKEILVTGAMVDADKAVREAFTTWLRGDHPDAKMIGDVMLATSIEDEEPDA